MLVNLDYSHKAIKLLSLLSNQFKLFKLGQKLKFQRSVFVKYFTRLVSALSILGSASLITFLLWSIGSITNRCSGNNPAFLAAEIEPTGRQGVQYGQTPLYGHRLYTDTSLLRTVWFVPTGRKALTFFPNSTCFVRTPR